MRDSMLMRINAGQALVPPVLVLSVFAGGDLAAQGAPGADLAQCSQPGENLRALLMEQHEAWIEAIWLKMQVVS